jgi:decaprenylphospho-beta-D-ribofuranose 2-oxidase
LGRRAAGAGRAGRAGAIARGRGRSYGDAAQIRDGLVIDTAAWTRIELDRTTGVATVGAGVTLRELLAAAIGAGWIVPVVPGTQHVSVGGAIAGDIHGKNHGTLGTFGRHVRALGLLTSTGDLLRLQPGDPDRRFEATLGGMGLTGVIAWAQIGLRRVSGSSLAVDTDRAADLDAILLLLGEPGGEHRVAWLDLLAGRGRVRGVVTRAAHHDEGPLVPTAVTARHRMTVPAQWPGALLRPEAVRAFNALRFRLAPNGARGHLEPFGSHMFPLDGLGAWPRLYGPAGLLQYQLVVPRGAEAVLRQVLDRLAAAGVPIYLAVLKDFGPAGDGLLSFPIEGWTLALDVPAAASGLAGVLDRCDELVAEAGGRVYLCKDVRMNAEATRAMYPRLAEWQAIRDELDPDGVWRSDLGVRAGLVGEAR